MTRHDARLVRPIRPGLGIGENFAVLSTDARSARLDWNLVIPVKSLRRAKSRLAPMPGWGRATIALAMAVDTVTAALAAERATAVLVVTPDTVAGEVMRDLGAEVICDRPRAGLNPALAYAARVTTAQRPAAGIAALSADLPALGPAALDAALEAASRHPVAIVADAAGDGTTMLCARRPAGFAPMFGRRSADRHRRAGATDIDIPGIATLRHDVDTPDDLARAQALGVGSRTAHALDAVALATGLGGDGRTTLARNDGWLP
jgi:2-phospho-L-lactate guanylyltransferase